MHQLLRTLPLLQGRPLRALHRWRRLDSRPHHQRRPSGVRAESRSPTRPSTRCRQELSNDRSSSSPTSYPPSYEVGILNGGVTPGDTVAIVGAGPIGLAAILTAKLFTPGHIIAINLEPARLARATQFGADTIIDNGLQDAVKRTLELTGGLGADVAIEAVGVPETFELCTELVRPGGRIANVGVHGHPATLHLEKLWIKDVTITTGLVDTNTTPRLMQLDRRGRDSTRRSSPHTTSRSRRPSGRTRCSPTRAPTTHSRSSSTLSPCRSSPKHIAISSPHDNNDRLRVPGLRVPGAEDGVRSAATHRSSHASGDDPPQPYLLRARVGRGGPYERKE